MLKHVADQTAPEALTDAQLDLVTGGLFKEIIAGAERGYGIGSSAGLGYAGGVVGGAIGAVYGWIFG
jgi:hypothetical protein